MKNWTHLLPKLVPWWLSTGEGGIVLESIGRLLNGFAEKMRYGLLVGYPSYAPEDALAEIGRDRKIIRGINEPADAYAARCQRYLTDHRVRGNPWALMDQLRAYCQCEVRIRTVDRSGNWYCLDRDGSRTSNIDTANWNWDSMAASSFSRFWVIIYPTVAIPELGIPHYPWSPSDAGAWPSGGTIGTTATPDQVAAVRAIILDWQPEGTRCEWIIVAFDAGSFAPDTPEPDGTWHNCGTVVAGDYVPARIASARYWKGVDGGS